MKKILISVLGVGLLVSGLTGVCLKANCPKASAYIMMYEDAQHKEIEKVKHEYKKLTDEEKKAFKEKYNSLTDAEKKELRDLRDAFKREQDPKKKEELKEKFREYKKKLFN